MKTVVHEHRSNGSTGLCLFNFPPAGCLDLKLESVGSNTIAKGHLLEYGPGSFAPWGRLNRPCHTLRASPCCRQGFQDIGLDMHMLPTAMVEVRAKSCHVHPIQQQGRSGGAPVCILGVFLAHATTQHPPTGLVTFLQPKTCRTVHIARETITCKSIASTAHPAREY